MIVATLATIPRKVTQPGSHPGGASLTLRGQNEAVSPHSSSCWVGVDGRLAEMGGDEASHNSYHHLLLTPALPELPRAIIPLSELGGWRRDGMRRFEAA